MTRSIVRRAVVTTLVVATLAVAAVLIAEHLRRNATPRFEIAETAIPFSREISLEPGEAVVLALPDNRDVAVWCERASSSFASHFKGGLGMGYGEKPFKELKRDKLSHEYLSHIRQGAVFDGGRGMPSEYILFVNPYRISLAQLEIKSRMRMRVTVTHASEAEQVSRKDQVDFHLGRLSSPDIGKQLASIRELESLVTCGHDHAVAREAEIRETLLPLATNPDPRIAGQTASSLREMGDAESILRAITPSPEGTFLNAQEASALGRCTKSCKDFERLEEIYRHALSLFDSDDEQIRAFAAAFFAFTKPVPEAQAALINALRDPSPIVRAAAVRSLVYVLNEQQSRSLLPAMLTDPDDEVVLAVLETSTYLGDTRKLDFKLVEAFLASPDNKIRAAATRAIQFEGTAVSKSHILRLSTDPDAGVRTSAAEALAKDRSTASRDRLVELLEDEDRLVRIRSVQGLRHGGHADAIPEIENLLTRETDPDVIRIATDAIARLR